MNYIGVDIGGSKTRVALGDQKGKILQKIEFLTPKDPKAFVRRISLEIRKLAPSNSLSIGIGVPGLVDRDRGRVIRCPNLPLWKNFSLSAEILQYFKKAKIGLENDADLAALAEAKKGVGKNKKAVLYVGLGTGIGIGVFSNGKIYHGLYGTEGGHIVIRPDGNKCGCGSKGCWEAYNSGKAILERLKKTKNEKKFWQEISKELALGFSILSVCFVPEVIVIGGGAAERADQFLTQSQQELKKIVKVVPCPKIKISKFKKVSPGLVGAVILANQR